MTAMESDSSLASKCLDLWDEEEEPLNKKKTCKEEEGIPEKERLHWCDPGRQGCPTCECGQGENI